ncbi:hypothetical protein TanjilG_05565 [Lupinus angustifolius]|uniref:Uncharacterized protein n=1 Tax=Lupinus angustifolius TaxID=3871 RepID=A0A4P1QSB1_LUPAN|nr:hypothetical protein TanjilG_05565 [Lupinus angustifolius]
MVVELMMIGYNNFTSKSEEHDVQEAASSLESLEKLISRTRIGHAWFRRAPLVQTKIEIEVSGSQPSRIFYATPLQQIQLAIKDISSQTVTLSSSYNNDNSFISSLTNEAIDIKQQPSPGDFSDLFGGEDSNFFVEVVVL